MAFQIGPADADAIARHGLGTLTPWQQTMRRRWRCGAGAVAASVFAGAAYAISRSPWVPGMACILAAYWLLLAFMPPGPRFLRREARRWARRMAAHEAVTLPSEVRITPAGVAHSNGSGSVEYPWADVEWAARTAELIVLHPGAMLSIPIRAFARTEEADQFWAAADSWRWAPAPWTPSVDGALDPVSFTLQPEELLKVAQWHVSGRKPPTPLSRRDKISASIPAVFLALFPPALLFVVPWPKDWIEWLCVGIWTPFAALVVWTVWRVPAPSQRRPAAPSRAARLWARTWERSQPGMLKPCTVAVSPAGVLHATARRRTLTAWPRIKGVHRVEDMIVLDTDAAPLAIPVRAFARPSEAETLADRARRWQAAA